MRVPESAKLTISDCEFHGSFRPKHFFVIEVASKAKDLTVRRYCRSWPVLLVARMWWHRRKAIIAYKKALFYKESLGL